MMRRMISLLSLMLLCSLLCACQAGDPIAPMASTATDLVIPAPDASVALPREAQVTLWFRFGTEPWLAPESRTIDLSPTAPLELTLLQTLTGGPSASSTELTGLFPPGTRVLATHRQGRTLFVTLSRQIMNNFADEPDAWASHPDWTQETPLRRELAMQAIVATVTENCDVDQVVVLVEQTEQISDSLRLRNSYYRTGGDETALAAPLVRDERLLLTPRNTLSIVMDCWQQRDWPRLYLYITRTDPASGETRPAYDAFVLHMDMLIHLTSCVISDGSVSTDGQSAVFTAEVTLLEQGQPRTDRWTLRLHRERGIWRIGLSQLNGREDDLP